MKPTIKKIERSFTDFELQEAKNFFNSELIEVYEEQKPSNWNLFLTNRNYFLAIPSEKGRKSGSKTSTFGDIRHVESIFKII